MNTSALLGTAILFHRYAMPFYAFAVPVTACPRLAFAIPVTAFQCPSFAVQRITIPPHCSAVLFRRDLLPDEAPLSTVAPLSDARIRTVVQPLPHQRLVRLREQNNGKLNHSTRRDLLADSEGYALSHGR